MISHTKAVLEAAGLSRSFGAIRAVQDVSFEVRPGQTVSIIGPNGSGKTTTLNLVTGVVRPERGTISINGKPLAAKHPVQVALAGVRRTFQNGRVFGNLTVAENVEVGLHQNLPAHRPFRRLLGVPGLSWIALTAELVTALVPFPRVTRERRAAISMVGEELDRFGDRLTPRADRLAFTLSYANRRRTEIARSLVGEPDLLVLDEPTAGMNQSETAEVTQQLLGLKAAGQTILLVEHKLDLVMRLSDWVIVMDEGRVISAGPPEQVRIDPAVVSAYLGKRFEEGAQP